MMMTLRQLGVFVLALGISIGGCFSGVEASPDMSLPDMSVAGSCNLKFCNDTSQCAQGQVCIDYDRGNHGCYTPGQAGCGDAVAPCNAGFGLGTMCAPSAGTPTMLWRGYQLPGTSNCVVEIVSCKNVCIGEAADGGAIYHCE